MAQKSKVSKQAGQVITLGEASVRTEAAGKAAGAPTADTAAAFLGQLGTEARAGGAAAGAGEGVSAVVGSPR